MWRFFFLGSAEWEKLPYGTNYKRPLASPVQKSKTHALRPARQHGPCWGCVEQAVSLTFAFLAPFYRHCSTYRYPFVRRGVFLPPSRRTPPSSREPRAPRGIGSRCRAVMRLLLSASATDVSDTQQPVALWPLLEKGESLLRLFHKKVSFRSEKIDIISV